MLEEEEKEIRKGKYKKTKILVGGGMGNTFICHLRADPTKEYVLKMIDLEKVPDFNKFEKEAKLHQKLSAHESIINIIEYFIEDNILIIVTEYAKKGDLSRIIREKNKKKESYTDTEILALGIEIAKGVTFIHSQHIVHRDLKPANIFLTEEGKPKIGDFGIAGILIHDFIISGRCTPEYAPPEQLTKQHFDYKRDVWSFGVILYELCTGSRPFSGLEFNELVNFILKYEPDYIKIKNRNPLISELIKSMLRKRPKERPTMQTALRAMEAIYYKVMSQRD